MDVMKAIYQRRSVRGYTDQPLSRETLETLLQAAVQAPSGMNSQPWAFGVIQGVDRLRGYSDRTKAFLLANMEQFPMLERYRANFANADFNIFYGAPALILICAKAGATPEIDCSMAAQNIMLTAVNMGLGSCWIGFFGFLLTQPDVQLECGIPQGYRPIAPIALGYPSLTPPLVDKAAPEVLFWHE